LFICDLPDERISYKTPTNAATLKVVFKKAHSSGCREVLSIEFPAIPVEIFLERDARDFPLPPRAAQQAVQ